MHDSHEFSYREGDLKSPLPFIIKNGGATNTNPTVVRIYPVGYAPYVLTP